MGKISQLTDKMTGVIVGVITAVVFLAVGVTLMPTVIAYFAWINATSVSAVTMGSILVLFAGYGAFFYVLGLVGGAIAILVGAVKFSGK